jgi:hypothetical protein
MTMRRYGNQSGSSGVVAFELGEDFIDVKFKSGEIYHYTSRRPGFRDVIHMKELALRGALDLHRPPYRRALRVQARRRG